MTFEVAELAPQVCWRKKPPTDPASKSVMAGSPPLPPVPRKLQTTVIAPGSHAIVKRGTPLHPAGPPPAPCDSAVAVIPAELHNPAIRREFFTQKYQLLLNLCLALHYGNMNWSAYKAKTFPNSLSWIG